ncbi:MAG: NADH-quinone oxidoreductase subunit C [Planctomycetes bacterium]|nr:NADH-quinone oxidoreductase subunit C [Planctomycetota bacterium]
MPFDTIITALKGRFADLATSEFRDNRRVVVAPAQLFDVLKSLQEEHGFDLLFEMTAADYLKYPNAVDRFGVVYGLLNTVTGERVFVKTVLNEPDLTLPSAFSLWKGADWLEREIYDMYGILFDGHPDLRRILMPEAFAGHPLRKDYPLRGRGERHNFPVITRANS